MARVVAADDEWRGREPVPPLNCKMAIEAEKRSAEGFKHGAACHWRQKHILRVVAVSQSDASVVWFAR